MMTRLLVLIAALAAAAMHLPARAQTTETRPFGQGEELIYNVSYRAALIPPINMMRISIRTLNENFSGRPHYHIVGNGRTTGAAKGVFNLNDTYHSWIDQATLLPSRMTSDLNESNYRFRSTYTYDWNTGMVATVLRKERWTEDQRENFELPGPDSGDALSLLYRLRAIDTSALVPGQVRGLGLVLDRDAKPITLRFVGRESVKIRRLGTFRALRFTCTMATSDGSQYEEGMAFTAWISDDENRIPLMIESPVRVGRVSVTLAEGFRTVHPMTSFVR